MTYRIEFAKPAVKQFKALPPQEQQRLKPKIDALAHEPRPAGMVKLAGEDDLCRIRVGDYRIVYTIEDARLLVLVVRVRHRREVYR
ncbi:MULTISPECIES: type II toxin-antitoxin system RelE/ParE family toxin [Cyanophyceae]|uniref:type II toxin-antitoxin system RelE family toxin n=1 Tax=Cyanophyceae TaxID=3028117 RepID=UPI00168715F8|nr:MULTISPECIES: type II toxin-antitoxin system RelE/ParE family toxin [Cyanophyceae]MBD1915020.1 type II toxin-antitoxin system RelE/ParE family toxin [Phormidium sp. FACHB-77]MBD2029329.1 type II toxin-antitoxin system RelE/ParE family toxin [Phormidium sp. FACHB-322]MBD2053188.1 type II toxin-antitoxin system RelE/ParE family toxin [Leptolyngbya sp. FACHB-60]